MIRLKVLLLKMHRNPQESVRVKGYTSRLPTSRFEFEGRVPSMSRKSMASVARLGLVATFLQFSVAAIAAPRNISILETNARGCDVPMSSQISDDRTKINILYDTRKSNGSMQDSLAWTDSVNGTESTCIVCTTFSWTDKLYGYITSLEYDFDHRLDLGLLEQVATIMFREKEAGEVSAVMLDTGCSAPLTIRTRNISSTRIFMATRRRGIRRTSTQSK